MIAFCKWKSFFGPEQGLFKSELQKLNLSQSLSQKLSPQQKFSLIKLLRYLTAELDTRIERRTRINPAWREKLKIKESSDGNMG